MKRNTVQKTKSDIPAAPRRRAKAVKADPAADAAATAAGAEQALRIIKKYPNRRLYDTTTSSYITLTDVRALVMSRSSFAVRDAKTNEDLTRAILLQIILEEEAGGAPMFTEQVLANIIRFYGNAMQGFMGTYLEKNVQTLMELQSKLAEQSKGLSPEVWAQFLNQQSPLVQGAMGSYLEQSKQLFTQMQDQLQKQSTQMLSGFGLKL
jgi:polyhydroxyalkanoate synthesis repressor PhaR